MGNGPFREPEAPQSTVPTGRARYGGVSPLLQNPGDGNKTKDPYFTPPKELPKKSPFAEPPSIKKESPSLQPDDSKVKFNPKINHKWTDTSPKNGFANSENRSEALAELDEAFGSQALKLLQAKQRQTGSITARGIIAGAGTGALSEPIGKLARLGINALDNAPEGTIRNYVGSRLSRHFTERGSL